MKTISEFRVLELNKIFLAQGYFPTGYTLCAEDLRKEREFVVEDFLVSLRAYCDAHGLDFGLINKTAYTAYLAEKANP